MQRASQAVYRGADRRYAAGSPDCWYRGPDRRTLRLAVRHVLAPVAAAIGALVLLIELGSGSSTRERALFLALRNLSWVLLLLAGTAYAVSWRLSGRASAARVAAAFAITGGLMIPLQAVALVQHVDPELQLLAPGCGLALGAAGVAQCIRSTRCRSVEASSRPGRDVAPLTLGAMTGVAVLVLLRRVYGPLDDLGPWVVATGLLGAGWLVAAGCLLRPALGGERKPLLASAVGGLAAGDLLLAVGIDHHPSVATAAAGLLTTGAATALLAGLRAVEGVLGRQGDRSLRMAGELGDTVRLLAQEQSAREEMLHDARSALAAVRLANGTLSRHQERLDALLTAELRDAVDAELVRLEHLLTREAAGGIGPVVVADVLAPVVRVAAEAGLDVTCDLVDLPVVLASGDDLGAVVHTLLTNAGRYAPGSPVEVRGSVDQAMLRVTVSDRGPGVDPDERDALFERGRRGRASLGIAGSGLGLFVARWLMAEQGGDLSVEPRPGGGACFVATIPIVGGRSLDARQPLSSAMRL